MGKIRVKTLGNEEQEQKQIKKAQKRKEAKQQQIAESSVIASGAKQSPDSTPADAKAEGAASQAPRSDKSEIAEKKVVKKPQPTKKKSRGKKYAQVAALVDRDKIYSLTEALEILPKLKTANFDETVELHINTIEAGISGTLNLPHGTGKQMRVAVADDAVLAEVEKGKITFDILLATPQMMPKLARVAKVLGPRGLMPNPKAGTITNDVEEAKKKYAGGQMNYKTETKIPVVHLTVGKLSFGPEKLKENIQTALNSVQAKNIRKVVLKSTMSPGIKLNAS